MMVDADQADVGEDGNSLPAISGHEFLKPESIMEKLEPGIW